MTRPTILYVESSAIVAWLLDQPGGWPAFDQLRNADHVITSELTAIECDRALRRHVAAGRLEPARADLLRAELASVSQAWDLQPIMPEVIERARGSFPDEQVRTLDAIHLASALVARAAIGDIGVVTLDDGIRRNAMALDFAVLPV